MGLARVRRIGGCNYRPDMLLYVGGNLVVGDRPEDEVVALFKSWGFDRVFYRNANFTEMFSLLRQDLEGNNSNPFSNEPPVEAGIR